MKKMQKKATGKVKCCKAISYRLKGAKTSNGLSHFVPKEKKTLV